jgi:hypothetical protein
VRGKPLIACGRRHRNVHSDLTDVSCAEIYHHDRWMIARTRAHQKRVKMDSLVTVPYQPVRAAPAGSSLEDLLEITQLNGHPRVGKLSFASEQTYGDYVRSQRRLPRLMEKINADYAERGKRGLYNPDDQLAMLHHVTNVPFASPHHYFNRKLTPAPRGTTVDRLLTSSRLPNANGNYELGTLRVHETEYSAFAELQRELCGRNPDALALLYHMRNAQDGPVTFRVTNERPTLYQLRENTLYWNPNQAGIDPHGVTVPPSTTALHEEAHWAGRRYAVILANIPDEHFSTLEESRVIHSVERRDAAILNRPERRTHQGRVFNVLGINSTTPELTCEIRDARWPEQRMAVRAGFRQSGRIVEADATGTIKIDTGHGRTVVFKTNELRISIPKAEERFDDAERHRDQVEIGIGERLPYYRNEAQIARLRSQGQAAGRQYSTQGVPGPSAAGRGR